MPPKICAPRFWTGLAAVLAALVIGFSAANLLIPNWGVTPAERSLTLPGDEFITSPLMEWNHAITINAPPEQVWPWLIQMGDTRGGFYSYMWIEKATNAAFGVPFADAYNNANAIHSEWQNPEIGQGMILDALVLRQYERNSYVLAGPGPDANDTGLFWGWYLRPIGDGRTRLLVRMAIQIPGMEANPVIGAAMNLLTFMMERKMMTGIKLRAEGGSEAPWVQTAELMVGLMALFVGLVAARRFVTRPDWKFPLLVGLGAVAALFVMIYVQPALWARILIDLVLIAALEKEMIVNTLRARRAGLAPQGG